VVTQPGSVKTKYQKLIKESSSQYLEDMPRNTLQLQNHRALVSKKELKQRGIVKTNDELFDMVHFTLNCNFLNLNKFKSNFLHNRTLIFQLKII
jgi:hypothetical protein